MWPRAWSRTGGKYHSDWWKVHYGDRGIKPSLASAGLAPVEHTGRARSPETSVADIWKIEHVIIALPVTATNVGIGIGRGVNATIENSMF